MSEDHWLLRLDAEAWLHAGQREHALALAHLGERRKSVTHLRRSGGMGCNAVLRAWANLHEDPDEAALLVWGRSYIDHLRALARGVGHGPLPAQWHAEAQSLAAVILAVPMETSELVTLGARRHADLRSAAAATARLLSICADAVEHVTMR